ncbi:Light-independent protochlorophyllide reductase iron-sulfur ATP-binding protein [uncultured archaeon]|nr:Light-independent protochlorophyllide reductase iron-sulfur ATP-binding protein [uncultured archaeon]
MIGLVKITMVKDTKVVSFINYKGGVGKTTLAVEISASLAKKGKDVLLIDLDPQTNATFYLMEEKDWNDWQENKGSLKDLFEAFMDGKSFDINKAINKDLNCSKYIPKLHLLPSHLELLFIDLELASKFGAKGMKSKSILRSALSKIKENYDYIIFDCPPNLNLVTQNSIVASNSIIIVAMPEYLSTIGIALIDRAIKNIEKEINDEIKSFGVVGTFKGPEIKGILFNRVRYVTGGTGYQEEVMERVRVDWSHLVFNTYVSQSDRIAQRGESKIPIAISGYAADKKYESQLRECAEEFLRRV